MREPGRFVVAPVPSCEVLTVDPWIWDMLELGHMIQAGTVRLGEVDARTWSLGQATYAAVQSGRAAAEETERKRREAVQAAARQARGGL